MKRKWMWALGALLLVVGLVVAKRLADERPRLVARQMAASHLLPSADGKWLFMQYRDADYNTGRIVGFDGNSLSSTQTPDLIFCVLPSVAFIYRIRVDATARRTSEVTPEELSFYSTDFDPGASKKQDKKRFFFPGADEDLYGACLRGNQILVESRQQSWRLNPRNLHVLSVQKQNRSLTNVRLCPDGRTLIDAVDTEKGIYEFIDLNTEKRMWRRRLGADSNLHFSFDGRLLVFLENGVVIARDTHTGKEKWRFRGPKSSVIALSPDENTIYEARDNGELWKWPR